MRFSNYKKAIHQTLLFIGISFLCSHPSLGQSFVENTNVTATDAVGRTLPDHQQTGAVRNNKFVGIFYWTWHTQQSRNGKNAPLNVTEYLARNPKAIDDYHHPIWPKENTPWFWGQPLFGYYQNTDEWVLRKHAEMLADAGVDMVLFDCTNGNFAWKESYRKLAEVWSTARKDGVKAPQIAFMLPFWISEGGKEILREIYNDLYKPGLYKDLWFNWKGKPLVMGSADFAKEFKEGTPNPQLSKELAEFFTYRPGQPVYNKGPVHPDHWGWLEIHPQHGFVKKEDGTFEQATVGVSQNWNKERGLTAMNAPLSFGRSYTDKKGFITETGAVNYGHNFQEQWDRGMEIDPELIFVTGWNEWIAGRYDVWQQQTNAFPDQFDQEHSRDIEPMKGGHGDNYYYQLAANVRKFKGVPVPQKPSEPTTITIGNGFAEWEKVRPEYQSYKGNTIARDHAGWGSFHYKNKTGRNDFVRVKVARDKRYVYFYAETAAPISSPSDAWMQLFINTDRDKNTGWEGYDLLINRTKPHAAKSTIEKTSASWNWQPAGACDYYVKDTQLELRVPRELIEHNGKLNFEFKWQDNQQTPDDIMDFYLSGDTAPTGRFNYFYTEE